MATFGTRLRELLEESHIQHKEFAAKLRVAPSTISNWLSGERFPNDEKMLLFIADYFSCTLDYLLGLTSEKNKKENDNAILSIKEYKLFDLLRKSGRNLDDLTEEEFSQFIKFVEVYIDSLNKKG